KDEIVGNRVRVKVVKNKVAAPFKQAEFDIMYNQGVASLADVLQTGVRLGVLNKSGAWFQFGAEKIGQGTEASVSYLKENPKVFADIVGAIKKKAAESQIV
ncbi:MAG: DNA recombination/repair protein RecA, partial [Patescibacteria group bacterium]